MNKTAKLFFILTIACLTLGIGADIKAQENTGTIKEIIIDEEVSSQDLEIKDPKLLPDSPFYFLKEWVRKIQITFTFNKVKRAELENKYANEKLIELKKLVENNADPGKIKKATENYQNQIGKIKERVDKIKEKAADSQAVDKFLDKFIKQQVLQEKILQKLEDHVPIEVFEKIKEAREEHLEKFGEVTTKLENRVEKIKEKMENTLNAEASKNCTNLRNELAGLLKQANYCSSDSDCIVSGEFWCFSCYNLFNAGSDLTALREKADAYLITNKCFCPAAAMDCAPPPNQKGVKCLEGKCVKGN